MKHHDVTVVRIYLTEGESILKQLLTLNKYPLPKGEGRIQ